MSVCSSKISFSPGPGGWGQRAGQFKLKRKALRFSLRQISVSVAWRWKNWQAWSAVVWSEILPASLVHSDQSEVRLDISMGCPSTWKCEVAAPHKKPGGKSKNWRSVETSSRLIKSLL